VKHRPISFFAAATLAVAGLFPARSQSVDPAAAIPDRPEKLSFPPLAYEPPTPADYRVKLKGGPIAYVVPDRELPLVNIAVYVRAGDYVEPEGKEALSEITGYLLTKGGTQSKTAEELDERLAFLAATTLVFGAAYTLWMYKRVIFGPVANEHVASLTDLNPRELAVLASLAVAVLFMGIYPLPFTDVMHAAVNELLRHVALSKS